MDSRPDLLHGPEKDYAKVHALQVYPITSQRHDHERKILLERAI
jgi:hypothetical protein